MGGLVSTLIQWAMKYLIDRLASLMMDKGNFFVLKYSISSPCKTRITNYIDICFSSLFATNTKLNANMDVTKYIVTFYSGMSDAKAGSFPNAILSFFSSFCVSSETKSFLSITLLSVS